MTLRADLTALLADTGLVDVEVDEALADEHVRSLAYRRVVSATADARSRDGDRAIVAAILRDPDEAKSKTAVVQLVDAIAPRTDGPAEFRRWAADILPETDRLDTAAYRAFIRRRVEDWLCWLSIGDGHLPTMGELAEVTDWMQRRLAEESTSAPLLALLAEAGGTRKIRNIASNRAASG